MRALLEDHEARQDVRREVLAVAERDEDPS